MTESDKTAAAPAKKPVFNIDANPDNANWIRILARRNAANTGEPADGVDPAPETAEASTSEPGEGIPPPPVIEPADGEPDSEPVDVEDVPLEPVPTPNDDRPGFATKGWSARKDHPRG
jgi:hypothetical protein